MKTLVLSPNYTAIKRNNKWRLYKTSKASQQRINKLVADKPFEIKAFCKEYQFSS
jgi:hypothetical protein